MAYERLLWEHNTRSEGVISSSGGVIVFPSDVNQSAPSTECKTRTEPVFPGVIESCVLFRNPKGKSFVAYPEAGGAERIQLPGVLEPMEITWSANPEKEGEVMASIVIGDVYYRIFPGQEQWWPNTYRKDMTTPWSSYPTDDQTTSCFVNWRTSVAGSIIGNAYPVIQETDEEELVVAPNRLFSIAGVADLVLYNEVSHIVTARRDENGVIVIELTPTTPGES